MNLHDWQVLSGAYWPSRKNRLIYAIQHNESCDEFARLPAMQWIRVMELLGEYMKG